MSVKPVFKIGVVFLGVLMYVQSGGVASAATITLNPGDDIQAAVTANPASTTFVLNAGTYRFQSVVPKNGDSFDGQHSAVLTGAKVLTGFTQSGAAWKVTGQTQQGPLLNDGQCLAGYPRCAYPEDLYIDTVPMLHVSSLAQVGPGKWFFDYTADTIYIGDNPVGHTVETSVTTQAFSGTATGVTIKNLTVEKYASPLQWAAIAASGSSWTIQDSVIRLNHSLGVDIADNGLVYHNKITSNGMAGYGGGGVGFVFDSNEVSNNNYAGVGYGWEGGGGKITDTPSGAIIRNNCVANNKGPGIWQDINANGVLIENNVVFGNVDNGIMYEISYNGIIRNNVVANNGSGNPAGFWLWSPQILVSSSQGVQVYGNTVDVPSAYGNGITVVSQNRKPWTPAINNQVYNNTVNIRGNDTVTGVVSDVAADISTVASQNHFYNNTYHVLNFANDYWFYNDGYRVWSAVPATGQETGSTADTNLPAAPALSCAYLFSTPTDTQAPTTPTGLGATVVSASQVNLSWIASTDNIGVTGYKVYRNGTQVGTSNTNSYSDTGLTQNTSYTYTVAAYDAAGNTSAQSASASATTQTTTDTQAPSVPSSLTATAVSTSQINLSWSPSTDNVGVTQYDVYRNGTYLNQTSGATTFSDTGLTPKTTYTYQVLAIDAVRNISPLSTSVSATTLSALTWKVGSRVQTNTRANVRNKASTSGRSLCTQSSGKKGTIVGGPTNANGYTWWNVNFDTSCDGWVTQSNLALIVAVATPAATFAAANNAVTDLTQPLTPGTQSPEVTALQKILNQDPQTIVAAAGVGSPGQESDYFGKATVVAVQKFQEKWGIVTAGSPATSGFGAVGPKTLQKLQELLGY